MSESKAQTLQYLLHNLKNFLEPYKDLVNAHMTNFITQRYWEVLPNSIKEDVNSLPLNDFYKVFWSWGECSSQLQGSSAIINFFRDCWRMSLASDTYSEFMLPSFTANENSSGTEKCMSVKKTHEVRELREVVLKLCENSLSTCVVDVGGGKGYLGASLVLEKNIPVLSIDSKPLNTSGAANVFDQLEKVKKGCPGNHSFLYKQVTAWVTPETDLCGLSKLNYGSASNHKICLTGLHVCGDLSSTCIKLFCKNPDVLSMCTIGCCYNLLTEKFEINSSPKNNDEAFCGYPVSEFLCKLECSLGRNARMIACQSLERICHEKKVMQPNLFWRAVVQVHFERLFGADCNILVGRSCSKATDITEYFRRVEKASNRNLELTEEKLEELVHETQIYKEIMDKFNCLRLALAPVVEALIILDRLLFIYEQGIENAYISKVFDGVKSPRCYAIIALKK